MRKEPYPRACKVDETTAEELSVGDSHCRIVSISARNYKRNIDQLGNITASPRDQQGSVIIASVRHYEHSLAPTSRFFGSDKTHSMSLSGDLINEISHLSRRATDITGGQITPNGVGNIFKHFCIGK